MTKERYTTSTPLYLVLAYILLSTHAVDAFVGSTAKAVSFGASKHVNTNHKKNKGTAIQLSSSTAIAETSVSFAGMGSSSVDMNRYNIPLEQISEEWTARMVPRTPMQEEGVYLGVKSENELFVDTITYEIGRAGGLGIELVEVAGGRGDGLGITVVSGVVEGGNADVQGGIMPGDSIVNLSVIRTSGDENGVELAEIEEETAVATECLDYDATVDAILSLPEVIKDDESVMVTVKRIRRKPRVSVTVEYPPSQNEPNETLELFAGENLRRAMLTRGIKLNDALQKRFDSGGTGDCGAEGTCATCLVGVTNGSELLSPMGLSEKQILAKKPGWRMACKTVLGYGMKEGEMTIRVNPRQWD